jgi:hypothetical protein
MPLYATLPVGMPPEPTGPVMDVTREEFSGGADADNNDVDDSPVIAAAIAAGGDGPFTLYFPAGTYNVAGALTLEGKSGVSITGDGMASSIIKRMGPYWPEGSEHSYANLLTTDPRIFVFRECADMCVRDIAFDVNGTPCFGGVGWFGGVRRLNITHTRCFNSKAPQPSLEGKDRYSYTIVGYPQKNEDIWITENVIEDLQLEVDRGKRVLINGNVIQRPVASAGIACVSANFEPGPRDGGRIEDYTISNNVVANSELLYMGLIALQLDSAENNNSVFRNIDVVGNTLVYDHDAETPSPAIKLGTGDYTIPTVGNRFENIRVEHNRIYRSPVCKIPPGRLDGYIVANGMNGDYRYHRLIVRNNNLYADDPVEDLVVLTRKGDGCVIESNQVHPYTAPFPSGIAQ